MMHAVVKQYCGDSGHTSTCLRFLYHHHHHHLSTCAKLLRTRGQNRENSHTSQGPDARRTFFFFSQCCCFMLNQKRNVLFPMLFCLTKEIFNHVQCNMNKLCKLTSVIYYYCHHRNCLVNLKYLIFTWIGDTLGFNHAETADRNDCRMYIVGDGGWAHVRRS